MLFGGDIGSLAAGWAHLVPARHEGGRGNPLFQGKSAWLLTQQAQQDHTRALATVERGPTGWL